MKLLKIGITHGDINGVGCEMLIKVLQDSEILEFCTPVIFGSANVIAATAAKLEVENLSLYTINHAGEAIDGRINLVPVCKGNEPEIQFGQQTEAALQSEAQSLTAALEAYSHRQIDALITLPGHLNNEDDSHALSDFIHKAFDVQEESLDWICNGKIRTLQLHKMDTSTQLGEGLASEAFQQHLQSVSLSLRADFGLMRPRLAVISPNTRLRNDIEELQNKGILVFGPFDAKQFIEGGWQYHYDGCIFLDADEARAQAISAEDAVNTIGYVSGLPVVLTYPITDISYDKAGQGVTDETSLRQAVYAALDIARSRHNYFIATRHPLEKHWIPRGRDDFKLDLTKEE